MTQLCISSPGRDLLLVVRLLAGLHVTGRLHIVQGRWAGDVFWAQGHVVAAVFAAEQGLAALRALLLCLPDGSCTFYAGVPATQTNIVLGRKALETELQQLAQRQAEFQRTVPSLAAVPWARAASDDGCVDEQITLPRSALLTLAAVDGRHDVEAICGGRNVVRTLEDLITLADQGLIAISAPSGRAPPLGVLQAPFRRGSPCGSPLSMLRQIRSTMGERLHPYRRPLSQAATQFEARARTLVSGTRRKAPSAPADRFASPSGLQLEPAPRMPRRRDTPTSPREEPSGPVGHRRPGTHWRLVQPIVLLLALSLGALALALLAGISPWGRVSSLTEPPPAPQSAAARPTLSPTPALAATPPGADVLSVSAPDVGSGSRLRLVLEEKFDGGQTGWPDDPNSTAWLSEQSYHLAVRQSGQFVAVGAPRVDGLRDAVLTASFRKSAGPSGSRYGLIVRDQGPGPRDGINTVGDFYVLLVNDRGEYSVARRDRDDWVDVIPWSPSDAIHPGAAANELVALAIGSQLGLAVNGTLVASIKDEALEAGGVGVYVNGDLAEVEVKRFLVEAPAAGQSDVAQGSAGLAAGGVLDRVGP